MEDTVEYTSAPPPTEVVSWRKQETERITKELREKAAEELNQARKDLETRLEAQNKQAIHEAMEAFKKEVTPPTPEEIQKTLDEEYLEFPIKLKIEGGLETYTLVELSSGQERQIIRILKEKLAPHIRHISEIFHNVTAGDWEERMTDFINTFEPALDVIHEVVAYLLNCSKNGSLYDEEERNGRRSKITPEQVRDNLSLNRQFRILKAQIEANRVRDFLSGVSKLAARLP